MARVFERDVNWTLVEYNSEALLFVPTCLAEFTNVQNLIPFQISTYNCHNDNDTNFMDGIYNLNGLVMCAFRIIALNACTNNCYESVKILYDGAEV
jgi:hypothetical protein